MEEIENGHVFRHNIQFTDFSMYLTLMCTKTILKQRTKQSDILLVKNIMIFPPNLMTLSARGRLAFPEWQFKWKRENRSTLPSCSTSAGLIKCVHS